MSPQGWQYNCHPNSLSSINERQVLPGAYLVEYAFQPFAVGIVRREVAERRAAIGQQGGPLPNIAVTEDAADGRQPLG